MDMGSTLLHSWVDLAATPKPCRKTRGAGSVGFKPARHGYLGVTMVTGALDISLSERLSSDHYPTEMLCRTDSMGRFTTQI